MINHHLRLLSKTIKGNQYTKTFFRAYGNTYSKEYDVSQFCNVNIKCPCNLIVKPIDVFQSQEKVLVNINSDNETKLPVVKTDKDGDTVSIDVSSSGSNDCTLNVQTSVKANLNIEGHYGNINIGSFYGEFINVKSSNGDISLAKSQCKKISLVSGGGNITCKDVTQAGDITLKTSKDGKIITDRLQGLQLTVSTTEGDINIGSSYCDNSNFETDFGQMMLQNIHKYATVTVKHEGLLKIVGFDGELFARINKGLIDIQLARLSKESEIIIDKPSSLILRLSEDLQKESLIKILSKNQVISNTLKMDCEQESTKCLLIPRGNEEIIARLDVTGETSTVLVDSASWSQSFETMNRKI